MNLFQTAILSWALSLSGQALVLAQSEPAPALPPLPKAHSPVEYFRKLLAATPSERDVMLKDRSESQRVVINTKIADYVILPPPVREWRLKATELRWYLLPLMQREPDLRGELLRMVPDEDRSLVELRLRQWDSLPPDEREEMLNSQIALGYLARPTKVPVRTAQSQSDPKLRKLESSVASWQRLPAIKRELITKQFNSFLALNSSEKQKTLDLFTGSERAQLQKTVHSFEGLSEDARLRCIDAMQKIARMSGDERVAFLRNAERWKSLSEQERRQWRTMVTKVPPLPPGLLPPSPPGVSSASVETNSL